MAWTEKGWWEYEPITPEDVVLFYDIPLIIHQKTRNRGTNKSITITLQGLYRKENISIKIPICDDNVEKIVQKACIEKWPLKDSFEYRYEYNSIDIKLPEEIGNIRPKWSAVRAVVKVAINAPINDRDTLFVSLYNEVLATNIQEFRKKYKYEKMTETMTATERALKIKDIPKEVQRFILYISDVMIERETGNDNKNTFDFIRIRMSVPTKSTYPDRKEFIKRNMRWFIATAMNKLNNSKKFMHFGVPTTCLSLKNATLTCTNELELLFELKKELLM